MHLTLNSGTYKRQTFLSFSFDFMFDRTICVLVRITVRVHLVMSIIQFMHFISVNFWLEKKSETFQETPRNHIFVYTQHKYRSQVREQLNSALVCLVRKENDATIKIRRDQLTAN